MQPLTAFLLTLSFLCQQQTTLGEYPRVYAVSTNGVEVLNLNAPGISLAYTSNLMLNSFPMGNVYTLYFLADRGSPNLYTAQFIPMDTGFSFWSTGRSNLTAQSQSMPFFSFDVYRNNVVGPAFPNNGTTIQYSKLAIQSVFMTTLTIYQESAASNLFVSTLIDPVPRGGYTYVYFAGWSNEVSNHFVVARARITLDSLTPEVDLDAVQDILGIPMPVTCYDQFSSMTRPIMKITNSTETPALILVVPGRCGFFAAIPLPDPSVAWKDIPDSSISTYSPLDLMTNLHYISSAVISPQNDSTIYFAVKTYSQQGAYLFSFDTIRFTPNSATVSADEIGEGEAVLVFGGNTPNNYLYLLGAGSNKIIRYTIMEKNNLVVDAYSTLSPTITQVSSALHFSPHLYFTTYEPDAKLVRVPFNNFCKSFCGDNGYCSKGSCQCVSGYSQDTSSSTFGCVLDSVANLRDEEKSTEGATAALGVFFAFSLLAALAGWGLWWKERKTGYAPVK